MLRVTKCKKLMPSLTVCERYSTSVSAAENNKIVKSQSFISQRKSVLPFESIPGPLRVPLWGNLWQYKLGECQALHLCLNTQCRHEHELIIGEIHLLSGLYNWNKYHHVLAQLHSKYGPIVREDLGPYYPVIHIFDPDDARAVYSAEGRTPIIRPLQETVKLYRRTRNKSPGLGNT